MLLVFNDSAGLGGVVHGEVIGICPPASKIIVTNWIGSAKLDATAIEGPHCWRLALYTDTETIYTESFTLFTEVGPPRQLVMVIVNKVTEYDPPVLLANVNALEPITLPHRTTHSPYPRTCVCWRMVSVRRSCNSSTSQNIRPRADQEGRRTITGSSARRVSLLASSSIQY